MIFVYSDNLSLSEAILLRTNLLSNIKVYALQLTNVVHDTCMNLNVIDQIFKSVPVYCNNNYLDYPIDHKVTCSVAFDECFWSWPPSCGLDCKYGPQVPMLYEQKMQLEFDIVSGTARQDAKFTAVNSVALREEDDGTFSLVIEHQRIMLDIEKEIAMLRKVLA